MRITRALKQGYLELCAGFEPSHFLTLATNGDGSIHRVRELAEAYCARMDRKLLGHLWHTKLAENRTDGVFFVEHVASNIHLHGMLRFPLGTSLGLEMTSKLIWTKLCPSGSLSFTPIYDLPNAVSYCLKESRYEDYSDEQIVLVRELMGERAHNHPTEPTRQR